MSGKGDVLKKLSGHVQRLTYGNPLYDLMLAGPAPEILIPVAGCPWPGDAQAGMAVVEGSFRYGGQSFSADPPEWRPARAAAGWFEAVHGFEWLRDLRAVGSENARKRARSLIENWIAAHDKWDADTWTPGLIGLRVGNWIAHHDFAVTGAGAAPDFGRTLAAHLAKQVRHLARTMPAPLSGMQAAFACKGMILGGLHMPEGEKEVALGLEFLRRLIAAEVLPDGGHIQRSPEIHLRFLQQLIDMRAALRSAKVAEPPELQRAIAAMTSALRFFRHADGALALFHGGGESSPLLVEAAMTQSEVKSRTPRRLGPSGYERMSAGRSLLLFDAGAPPPKGHDACAHAGLLAFEFSAGRERIIVNCGAAPVDTPDWRMACAATAAHSTVTVDDTNACEILPEGGLGSRPRLVGVQRYEQNGVQYAEATQDCYVASHGVVVRRVLGLGSEGEELIGQDILHGRPGQDFAVRWHLHYAVQASLIQGGQAALLRTGSGMGWRLLSVDGELGLEQSIYAAERFEAPRRTLQLVLRGRTRNEETTVNWRLVRERR